MAPVLSNLDTLSPLALIDQTFPEGSTATPMPPPVEFCPCEAPLSKKEEISPDKLATKTLSLRTENAIEVLEEA
jgi:hypothetical protein